jgi:hypothetical protein
MGAHRCSGSHRQLGLPSSTYRVTGCHLSRITVNPLAVVRRIYDRLGIQLTDSAAERMQRFASGKRGRGSAPTEDLGLDPLV